jgi:RNA polymerase sigma-70 factor (ECF subfamily)
MHKIFRADEDNDNEIVSLCRGGDPEAFEILIRKYEKKMFNTAYRMTGSYEDACEVVQDAFVSAYKNLEDFEGRSRFSTWLFAIAVNLSRNRIRRTRERAVYEQASLDDPIPTRDGKVQAEHHSLEPTVLEELERKEVRQKVQECISGLELEFRDVIVLRDIQGFSYEEIGEVLHIAEGTVKSRLFRGRESLRNCLKKTLGRL